MDMIIPAVVGLIILINCPLFPDGMRIVGRCCSAPCEEAKETLDYAP